MNVGVAFTKDLPKIEKVRIGIDYMDLFNANQALVGNTKKGDTYKSYKYVDGSYDFMQHLRVGATVDLVDNRWTHVALSTGLYQGGLTFGLDVKLAVLQLQFATYEENIGGGSDIDGLKDRRYTLMLSAGW